MSTLRYEQWDTDCTPPALPSGWNVDSVYTTTSTFYSGIAPTSSPNALVLTPVDSNDHYATWGTADGVGGNVTVQANFNVAYAPTHCRYGVTARGSAATLNSSSTTQYRAYADLKNALVAVDKVVAGTVTNIASQGNGGALTYEMWYQLAFTLNGTSLEMSIQRMADGWWLNLSGNFQSATSACLTFTDSSISGSGYAGLYGVQNQIGSYPWYSDDWLLGSLSAPSIPPNAPVIVRVPFGSYPCNQY